MENDNEQDYRYVISVGLPANNYWGKISLHVFLACGPLTVTCSRPRLRLAGDFTEGEKCNIETDAESVNISLRFASNFRLLEKH